MYIRIYSGHVAFGHATHVYSHTQGQLNPPSKQHAHDAWTNFILRCMATRSILAILYEDKKAVQCSCMYKSIRHMRQTLRSMTSWGYIGNSLHAQWYRAEETCQRKLLASDLETMMSTSFMVMLLVCRFCINASSVVDEEQDTRKIHWLLWSANVSSLYPPRYII